ncbi:ammonium transporter [Fulvivirga sp. 29W222]|uniref:Ammonium transporter n=1 Tax=Fulvivirga marina TaxID=2494733 RepID=A0A937FV24_9BACT|nr:ammonium transporter [Fulvivirga marina]MBL6445477.1 ammonium transporter [Fulvivirga marina]
MEKFFLSELPLVVRESTLETTASADSIDLSLVAEGLFTANNIWMMMATALVFIMHLGFAGVEAGFSQSKNTVNILFKNTLTPVIGILTYYIVGFNLMYPGFETPGWFAFGGFMLDLPTNGNSAEYASGGYTYWTDFLFQAMFAATAATIVSGAVAERIKISSYITFTLLFVGIVYPIVGSWKWGGGALDAAGFYDFAGSTLVHAVGGWGALAGIMLLGPRIGKYVDGKVIDKPGSSVPLATIGVFLLWLGWFGFNGGSVLSADPGKVSFVLVTTSLGACTGAIGGLVAGYFVFKRLDFGMVLNGLLAGLVGITAGADVISPGWALVVGFVAGILVVLSAITLDRLKLDDCVGAVSVHLVCGVWGTLAVGIFGVSADGKAMPFLPQLYGVAVCGATAFASAFIIFFVLKKLFGIRVSEQHEIEGLDSHEHGIRGYTIVYDE